MAKIAKGKASKAIPARIQQPRVKAAISVPVLDDVPGAREIQPLLTKHWSPRWSYILLCAVTLACLLPFSGRAFHVDDTLFVWTAQHITQQPWNPYGFEVTWDFSPTPLSDITQNPPLASYYAALIGSLFGWSERALHLGFLVPALAVVLGTYRLAQKFTSLPLVAALAALLTPGFLVSAASVMCDTMMVAIWVWAAVLWIEGLEPHKPLLLIASSLLIAASALTKYFAISLIPLLLAYSIFRLRRIGSWAFYLLIPIAALAAYQYWTGQLYGRGLLLGAVSFATQAHALAQGAIMGKALVGASFTGGCGLTALTFALLIWSRPKCLGVVFACGVGALAITLGWIPIGFQLGDGSGGALLRQHALPTGAQLSLYIAGGVSVISLAVADYWRARNADSLLLALWTLGTFVFAGFVNWSVNARSVLPLLPAIGILLARRLQTLRILTFRGIMLSIAVPLAIAGCFSEWIVASDSALANSARNAALLAIEKTRGKGGAVWFEGHWGFQYYMEKLGAHPLDLDHPAANSGDFIVIPDNNIQLRLIQPQLVASAQRFEVQPSCCVTTIAPSLGAGFYSSFWGPLPYAVGAVRAERYVILRLGVPLRI